MTKLVNIPRQRCVILIHCSYPFTLLYSFTGVVLACILEASQSYCPRHDAYLLGFHHTLAGWALHAPCQPLGELGGWVVNYLSAHRSHPFLAKAIAALAFAIVLAHEYA